MKCPDFRHSCEFVSICGFLRFGAEGGHEARPYRQAL
jgi:hypothetical protein